MPLTYNNWINSRKAFEEKYISGCLYLSRIGGNRERCSTIEGDINVYLVWATQFILLIVALPLICHKCVTYGIGKTTAIQKYERNHYKCSVDAYPIERVVVPFVMLGFLTYAFFYNLSNEVFTLFYFTFLTVSTQLICNLILLIRAQYEWGTDFESSHFSTVLRLYSQIILAHTFACTTFIVVALLLFASTNQELLHLFFIYKLFDETPTIIANELIHTVPVLVYLFLIKTHYAQDLVCTKQLLKHCVGSENGGGIMRKWNWYCLVAALQIPSLTYILLVDWNCVYGRLAMPFKNDEVSSVVAYILFGILSFTSLHYYLVHRVLMGPKCTGGTDNITAD